MVPLILRNPHILYEMLVSNSHSRCSFIFASHEPAVALNRPKKDWVLERMHHGHSDTLSYPYTYIYTHYTYIYIYIYIAVYVFIYIYIYFYISPKLPSYESAELEVFLLPFVQTPRNPHKTPLHSEMPA